VADKFDETAAHSEIAHERVDEDYSDGLIGFQLLREIGRGGMGVVWSARDTALDREVAVKFIQSRYENESAAAPRFLDEARITGQLQHPGIPAVYQVGQVAGGRPFLAMKLIKGETLGALLESDSSVNGLAVFEAVCQAVGYAHAHGVIHRDLKPSNIMVGAFGEVQVMDWGLAKVLAPHAETEQRENIAANTTSLTEIRPLRDSDGQKTDGGSMLGTPAYMAPEQAAGETHNINARSDVFGLGAVLCAVLTGRPPFEGKDVQEVRLNAIRGRTTGALQRLDACDADPGVVALCKQCLEADPLKRPPNGAAVAQEVAALRRAADDRAKEAELAAARAEVYAAEQRKRRLTLLWAGGSLAVALAAGIVGTSLGLVSAERKRIEAQDAKARAEVKEAETSSVLQFVEKNVFAAARPEGRAGGLGREVTLRQVLDAAAPTLAAGFSHQPLTEARLRLTLGQTYGYLGEWPTAETHYRQARAIYESHRGEEHPDTLRAASSHAESLFELKRGSEALPVLERTVQLQAQSLGLDNPDTLESMLVLANTYHQVGRSAEGIPLLESVVERRKVVLGPDHQETFRSIMFLAERYRINGQAQRAAELLTQSIPQQDATLGPNHLITLTSKNSLGICYLNLGREIDALPLFELSLKGRSVALGPTHPVTLQTALGLAILQERLGHVPEAIRVAEDAINGAAWKEKDPAVAAFLHQLRIMASNLRKDVSGFRNAVAKWEEWRKPTSGTDLYNLACWSVRLSELVRAADRSAAATKQADADADRAMDCLRRAVAAGYRNLSNIEKDKYLNPLRGRKDFQELVAALREKKPNRGTASRK